MRSRWHADLLPAAAGAAVEGVWTGAAAALVTGGSGAAWIGGAAAVTFCGAVLAARTGAGREPGRRSRVAAAALAAAAAAALYAAGRGWQGGHPLVAAVGALVFAALLVVLGIALGRERISADPALRRAVRAFALLCALLAIAALAGSAPAWATGAVVASLVAGTLSVTLARAGSLGRSAPGDDRVGTWRWTLAVAGIVLLVVAAGVLLSLVLRVDVLLWLLAVAGEVLQYLLRLLGFVLGWAGAGLLRALSWLLSLFHLHALPTVEPPKSGAPHLQAVPRAPRDGAYTWTRLALTVAAVAVAVVVPLIVVALALRRVRGSAPDEVLEERETVVTWREAGARAATRARRRLAGLVPRRSAPATPAEQVRRDYEELERRLARAGYPRPGAATVRAYLCGLPGPPAAGAPAAAWRPAELAGLYELARYSGSGPDAAGALRFRDLARGFPLPGGG